MSSRLTERRARRPARAILVSIAAATLLSMTEARAAVSIQPSFVTTKLEGDNVSEVVTVTNQSDTAGRFRAVVHHFVYSLDGSVQTIEPDEHSLAPWIKLNPRDFTLGPRASRVVRLAIVPPRGLAPGEYWAAIEFEPLEGVNSTAADNQGRQVQFKVFSTVYMPVVGTVGEATHSAELREVKALEGSKGIEVSVVLANTGTGRLRLKGWCEILDSSGSIVAEKAIGENTVLPGGVRRFRREFAAAGLPPGAARARVRYSSDSLPEALTADSAVEPAPEPAPDVQPQTTPDGVSSSADHENGAPASGLLPASPSGS